MRAPLLILWVTCAGVALAAAQRETTPAPRASATRISSASECAANLGTGVKSRRVFCDVVISATPKDSVLITIPAHTGTATLQFDLHNRFSVPVVPGQPALAFARHEAVVHVVRPTGEVIGRGAVIREFRTVADLFDQIGGGGRPGGVKAIAPGPAEAVRTVIPAGISSVGIVGGRLRAFTGLGAEETFDTPGRPVAIVSNVRVEYRPR